MESPERIWQLIARTLNEEASSTERDELFALLQKDPSLQHQYEVLSHVWKEKENGTSDEEDARRHIIRIISRAETETDSQESYTRRRQRRRRRLVMAASFFLVLIVAGWLLIPAVYPGKAPAGKPKEALVAQNGSRTRSRLPDGTTVWLNAGSRLFFINDFTGATREVKLEGEAFFDVVKKTNQPFIVHTSGIDIRVLGTAFNVKDYPEDKTVETTLYRGLIQVSGAGNATRSPIELRPNEKLVLEKDAFTVSADQPGNSSATVLLSPQVTIMHIDSTKQESERFETAWLYSRLEFRGDSFGELARKLERWYNVSIVFTDEKAKQLSFNGSFEKETVEQAFEALKAANSFSYKINKDEIFVGSPE